MGSDDLLEGGDGEGPGLLTQRMLAQVRTVTLAFLADADGSVEEAELVAEELVVYVEFNWHTRGLGILSAHPELWPRHLRRVLLQRWLGVLHHLSGESPPVRRSPARARVLALADAGNFRP